MKLKTLLLASSLALMPATAAFAQTTPQELEMVRDSWIFVFDDSVEAREVRGRAEQALLASNGRASNVYTNTIRGFSARMPESAARRIAEVVPNIAYVEADSVYRIVAPPPGRGPGNGGGDDGGGSDPAQSTPWGITRVNGGLPPVAGRTAWVIDSGVDQDHPDLNVDTARSANFVSRGRDTKDDGNGHGTHVAGTIGAIDNNIGVIGVAPGAPIVGVRVLNNNGSGSLSDVIAGIDYVAANAAPGDVANMSLGGGVSQALDDAVIAASNNNILFVLAAGNESDDAANHSPARANGSNIYTVSAFSQGDNFASFSNYGNPPVDCANPGVGVLSTYSDGGYATLSGTSMAAPHLAGILMTGNFFVDGYVNGDPDGNPDPICVR